MKVLITAPMFCSKETEGVIEYAKSIFDEVVLNPYKRTMTISEVKELWSGADAIVTGLERYPADVIAQAPESLKVIARNGVGYETVDVAAAQKRNISVTITRNASSDAVADCAVGLMLAIARKIPYFDHSVRTGQWGYYVATDVCEKTLGILGFGAIGKRVAKRAAGFDMKILAYDPFFDEEYAAKYGVQRADMNEILEASDFVTLHMPVTPETTNMIDAAALKKMKKTAYLINTARGQLVNEKDLYNALKSKEIQGAALDVFSAEPLYESPLFELENTVFTPHLGGHSLGATYKMGLINIDNILKVINHEPCSNLVKV